MEVYRISSRLFLLLGIFCLVTTLQGVQGGVESEGPSESECRPYIEKALKELETAEAAEPIAPGDSGGESKEEEEGTEEVEDEVSTIEITTDDSDHMESDGDNADNDIDAEASKESTESAAIDEAKEEADDDHSEEETGEETSSESPKITSAENETEDATDEEQSVEEHEEEAKDQDESDESPQSVEVEEAAASEEEQSIEEKEKDGSDGTDDKRESAEADVSAEDKVEDADDGESAEDDKSVETDQESVEVVDEEGAKSEEDEDKAQGDEPETEEDQAESSEAKAESAEGTEQKSAEEEEPESAEGTEQESAEATEQESAEATEQESAETTEQESAEETGQESAEEQADAEAAVAEDDASTEDDKSVDEADATASAEEGHSGEDAETNIVDESGASATEGGDSQETATDAEAVGESGTEEDDEPGGADDSDGSEGTDVKEDDSDDQVQGDAEASEETVSESDVKELEKEEEKPQSDEPQSKEETKGEVEGDAGDEVGLEEMAGKDEDTTEGKDQEQSEEEEKEFTPEEELINEGEIPEDLRPTDHIWQLLKLDDDNLASEKIVNGVAEITLRDLKKLYENAIKPLETLYKYRDLSNRHFGDAEIFSKPLVLFMGPWSGGKSSIINYLLNNEYNETSLRTGAEPSPAYFNILMYGEEPEVLDGTQLAADFTFSGLQKFGQGLEERLRGLKLPEKLLQKINIVEIPGILEVRKQVSRVFPFNDACQWFIDRADIIYLVYDPSKLDVGPETEAILDQLKGREHQTRMILNKADQVKPEELMRVQGALIWNISPLMSSAQPPVMYTTSLWSKPYELGAPVRLLQAQERAFLRDLRSAVDKRIENKIASARRFAVRVRNHAKMVDCYLTTYYNHKSVFGNRKQVSDAIIEHPQDYHIYEGLSTLTNISRYDLPDPDVYRDFFRLNPLYDFQQLSATCTYFRGCPINRLDVAIAYDLPELVGKHKRMIDAALAQANLSQTPGS